MENQRRNNIADMTITEQFEAIKEQMCDDYCKFRELSFEENKDPDDAYEWLQNNHCEHCPLGRL